MEVLNAALKYHKQGLSVIPCNRDKTPLIAWAEFQKRLATEDEIKEWFNKWPDANVAIVTGKLSNLTVLDCDSTEAVEAFRSIYGGDTVTVKTPRGTHYYFQYAEGTRNTVKISNLDLDLRSEGGYVLAPPSQNGFGHAYYFIKDFALALDSFNKVFFNREGVDFSTNEISQLSTKNYKSLQTSTDYFTEGRRDEDLFHIANCLVKSKCDADMIPFILEILANNCNPPYPKKDINAKIKSALERANRREGNLANEVREFVMSTNGNFFSTEIINALQLSTRAEHKNLSIILKRLCIEGLIDKYGDKNGHWRKKDVEEEIIDWKNATDTEYEIEFPLGLHNLCKIYPGNIAVIAGASNAGKTSFMLELIRQNMHKHPITYFNSEMGAQELKLRLNAFDIDSIGETDWKFTPIERSFNFADVIRPDGFNIIDYMEVYENFYQIGGWIRDVHAKLKNGIAVIAIQKRTNSKISIHDYGRGGEFAIEKPRLYLAMDRGLIKIVKAKLWRDSKRNPNGLMRNFKLVNGCNFISQSGWYTEGEEKEMIKRAKLEKYIDEDEGGFINDN